MTIYADTDFFLAIAKKEDWLKTNAQKLHNEHKGNIVTSMPTIVEASLIAKKKGIDDIENFIGSIFQIASVEGMSAEEGIEAAHLIQDENVNVFDAFHAVLSRGRPIVSSEHTYDKLGKKRIRLE